MAAHLADICAVAQVKAIVQWEAGGHCAHIRLEGKAPCHSVALSIVDCAGGGLDKRLLRVYAGQLDAAGFGAQFQLIRANPFCRASAHIHLTIGHCRITRHINHKRCALVPAPGAEQLAAHMHNCFLPTLLYAIIVIG